MTGTSLDGLDAALVAIEGSGLSMTARAVEMVSMPLGALRESLAKLARGEPAEPLVYMRAARALGQLHALAIEQLIKQAVDQGHLHDARAIDFVVAHGQTIRHEPRDVSGDAAVGDAGGRGAGAMSWQLMDPWPIVRNLGLRVCYDLRQADLIAGGQGAPITPLADWVLYRHGQRRRAIVNLGGICNLTLLPAADSATPAQITGGDIGPCNLLLDGLVARAFPGLTYDQDGKLAVRGGSTSLIHRLLRQAPYFSRPQPRSTGREDFNDAWLDALHRDAGLQPHDLIASAVEAVARLVADEVTGRCDEVILAGGGARNPVLVRAIADHCRGKAAVTLSDDVGIAATAREAAGFAVLGALSQDGVPITLPQITGSTNPGVAGVWAG